MNLMNTEEIQREVEGGMWVVVMILVAPFVVLGLIALAVWIF